ncbi:MAG TPA: type II secretion system major pseudopilin GspG [Verrucomicrobiae bacterium]|jgi:general secretion pathway protein G|nr:type II secretion system major pseudopilin GspG [Verrucomicrobiae bacterium]
MNKRRALRFDSTIRRSGGSTSRHGFTLVEVLTVCVILAILAATILPEIFGTSKDAKVSAAKSDISELDSAVERFYINMDRYPSSEEGLAVLTDPPADAGTKWHGPYIKRLRMDPWGNPFQYQSPGTHNPSSYDVWSKGAGGNDADKGGGEIGNW